MLVKALPHSSSKYGETVCCAGIDQQGNWRRLFPVRYRHLSGDSKFKRWEWVKFNYRAPTNDKRIESSHVYEETIQIQNEMPQKERAEFLSKVIVGSYAEAISKNQSLALVRPIKSKFKYKAKTLSEISDERESYANAVKQLSFFDAQIAEFVPCPYQFRFQFSDHSGEHDMQNQDWEANAMYWNFTKTRTPRETLEIMDNTFNVDYPKRGMVFALGNQAARQNIWMLLGVIRLDVQKQGLLF